MAGKRHKREAKKIAIFLDGTWNTPDDQTNVYKLFDQCCGSKISPDSNQYSESGIRYALFKSINKIKNRDLDKEELYRQYDDLKFHTNINYYDPGVGTRFLNRLRGGAFGRGVSKNIAQAYEFLCHVWEPGDEIYVFGFSRGAYTARSLVGLLSLVGLMEATQSKNAKNIDIVINYLHEYIEYLHEKQSGSEEVIEPVQDPFITNIVKERKNTTVRFIGVWDTVGALGVPEGIKDIFGSLIGSIYETLGDTELCSNVEYAYHAMAIDEQRPEFNVTPWTYSARTTNLQEEKKIIKDIEQSWFVGAHSNVGGGYNGNYLSDLPCCWLQQKSMNAGLEYLSEMKSHDNVWSSQIKDSFGDSAYYSFFRSRALRELGFDTKPQKSGVINETIHPSVWEYFGKNVNYKPGNIPDDIVAVNLSTGTSFDSVA